MSSSTNIPFQKHEVEDYERRRYRGLDQRIVDSREQRIVKRLFEIVLKRNGGMAGLVLDAPCGYGRFSGLIQDLGLTPVSSDLSFHMVNRARTRDRLRSSMLGVVSDLKRGLPFAPETFRLVLSMRFFHHLHEENDRANILGEFARVSSRWVILSYYELNSFHLLQRKIRRALKRSKTRIKMVPGDEFQREIKMAGLRTIEKIPLLRGIHAQHILLLEKVYGDTA
jgi:SAM-dependent methyltransferase